MSSQEPSRAAHCPRYVFWVIFKMDGKTSKEKEENSCKNFDIKSKSFEMYHMQVSGGKLKLKPFNLAT